MFFGNMFIDAITNWFLNWLGGLSVHILTWVTSLGGPLSVVLSDIYVCRMEENIVAPSKPLLYKCYVDDTYVRRKKNETDKLYNALNLYHQSIKLTLELNPTKFLDTEIIQSNSKITTQVYNKMKKLPVY